MREGLKRGWQELVDRNSFRFMDQYLGPGAAHRYYRQYFKSLDLKGFLAAAEKNSLTPWEGNKITEPSQLKLPDNKTLSEKLKQDTPEEKAASDFIEKSIKEALKVYACHARG